jgi:hypothetical protein
LVHLIGLGLVVGQGGVVGGIERAGLDPVPQLQEVLATDPDFAGELGGGSPLGDAAEDQEDLDRAELCPLPMCSCEHIEHTSTSFAAVVDDRGVGVTAVDVEPLAGAAPGAREPLGVEQIEEFPATSLLVHQIDDREVHGIGSGR